MNRLPRTHALAVVVLGAVSLLPGCGSGGTTVQGRVLLNGQPYRPGPDEQMQVTFTPATPGPGGSAVVGPDGTFTLTGPEKQGLAPGKYRIAVNDYVSAPKKAARRKPLDKFNGAFEASVTPLACDLAGHGPKPVVLDLGKRTATVE